MKIDFTPWGRAMLAAALSLTAAIAIAAPAVAADEDFSELVRQTRHRLELETAVRRPEIQAIQVRAAAAGALTVDVQLDGAPRTMVLHPWSLRADDFRARVDRGGVIEEVAAPAPRTWRGTLLGRPESAVAATVHEGRVTAVILDDEARWSVQPVADLLEGGAGGLHAAFRIGDLQEQPWACGTDDALGGAGGVAGVDPPPGTPSATCIQATRIAVDADYDFYLLNGASEADAIADIEGILNSVELIYATQAGIAYTIGDVIIRATPDTYTAANPIALLTQFQQNWNANHADIDRDIAHMMSGSNFASSVAGVAFVGVICDPEFGYGMTDSGFSPVYASRVTVTAHELGHNWSAGHCDGQADCGTMCSSAGGNPNCPGAIWTFGAADIASMIAFRDTLTCLAPGDVFDVFFPASIRLFADDGAANDFFGSSVALSESPAAGPVTVVGAPSHDMPATDAGAAYVFRYDPLAGTWNQEAKLGAFNDAVQQGDRFGTSVAAAGDHIAVGAPFDDTGAPNTGAVYIYRYDGAQWLQTFRFGLAQPISSARFGTSVAMSGNYLIVGAPGAANGRGAAVVYRYQSFGWQQITILTAQQGLFGDEFGYAVAIDDAGLAGPPLRAMVGATFVDIVKKREPVQFNAGAAYIFTRTTDTNWTQDVRLEASDAEGGDEFGSAVALEGESAVVGAWKEDEFGNSAGAAYAYAFDGLVWSEQQKVPPPAAGLVDRFGISVSLAGNMLAIGANGNNVTGENSGTAYVFGRLAESPTWSFIGGAVAEEGAPGDQFGVGVDADGGLLAVGSWRDAGPRAGIGSADVFFITVDCNGNGLPDACDIANNVVPDCNENGIPDFCDIAEGTSLDADGDGIPDECFLDCNENTIDDSLDIAMGVSADCNQNMVPDECDIAAGGADVDSNGVPDECQPDCNGNSIPDSLDIALGAPDCNGNGSPDSCDLEALTLHSGELSPLGGFGQTYIVDSVPQAQANVTLNFTANGDLNGGNEYVQVFLDDGLVGQVFDTGASDCPLDQLGGVVNVDQLTVPMLTWNLALADGLAIIEMRPRPAIDPDGCDGPSFITVEVIYASGDCNGNGIPDVCDVQSGFSSDCNLNLVPDECDFDCNENGLVDWCELFLPNPNDCNANFVFDSCEIDFGLADDCNGNGTPDACDIDNGTSLDADGDGIPDECFVDCNGNGVHDQVETAGGVNDCNGNSVPDDCEIDGGGEIDCNENGVPDQCDLANGPSVDCNANSIPDECDVESGRSADANANGVPDECEPISCPGDLDGDGAVDVDDLVAIIIAWGSSDPDADLDDSGVVDVNDLVAIIINWGGCG